MSVCCDCYVLSGRGLCDELITRPEESYRLWRVVCDQETSWKGRQQWPALGRRATRNKQTVIYYYYYFRYFCNNFHVNKHTGYEARDNNTAHLVYTYFRQRKLVKSQLNTSYLRMSTNGPSIWRYSSELINSIILCWDVQL
jgi:hypothetical protein